MAQPRDNPDYPLSPAREGQGRLVHPRFEGYQWRERERQPMVPPAAQARLTAARIAAQDDCVFCQRIARGEWEIKCGPAVAFTPLNPVTEGHLLVVPRDHVPDALESPYLTGQVMQAAAIIASARGIKSLNMITSIGVTATAIVRHLHVHLIPRLRGDGLKLPWSGQKRPA